MDNNFNRPERNDPPVEVVEVADEVDEVIDVDALPDVVPDVVIVVEPVQNAPVTYASLMTLTLAMGLHRRLGAGSVLGNFLGAAALSLILGLVIYDMPDTPFHNLVNRFLVNQFDAGRVHWVEYTDADYVELMTLHEEATFAFQRGKLQHKAHLKTAPGHAKTAVNPKPQDSEDSGDSEDSEDSGYSEDSDFANLTVSEVQRMAKIIISHPYMHSFIRSGRVKTARSSMNMHTVFNPKDNKEVISEWFDHPIKRFGSKYFLIGYKHEDEQFLDEANRALNALDMCDLNETEFKLAQIMFEKWTGIRRTNYSKERVQMKIRQLRSASKVDLLRLELELSELEVERCEQELAIDELGEKWTRYSKSKSTAANEPNESKKAEPDDDQNHCPRCGKGMGYGGMPDALCSECERKRKREEDEGGAGGGAGGSSAAGVAHGEL